jgi:quercetin dioxygenase-like cupin family protein
MLIRRPESTDATAVTVPGVKGVTMRVMVGRADGAPTFAMRHFTVAPGGHSPRHAHNYEHEVYVVDGRGRVEEDGVFHDLRAGDVVYVAPNVTHQFVNTGNAPFSFLCLVPTSFDCGGGRAEPTPGS